MSYLVVDADIVAYQAAAVSEHPINWGEGLWTLHAWEEDVSSYIDDYMFKLKEEAGVTRLVAAISDANNFRKEVAHDYKQNRTNTRRPMLLQFAKDYMYATWEGVIWPNLEADDVLGIMGSRDEDCIIWSADKDLKTIPCRQLVEGEVIEQTQEAADYWFYYQTLVGDATDNYKGCPRIGDVKAREILDKEATWERVVEAFEKAKLSEEVAIQQARLARILRDGEYNHDTGEVKLWTPTS